MKSMEKDPYLSERDLAAKCKVTRKIVRIVKKNYGMKSYKV